jgi:geranylgeranyl diphosphate synthase type II
MEKLMAEENFNPEEKIATFTSIYNSLGIKEVCEKKIASLFNDCDRYIDAVSVPAERKGEIKRFADSLLNRIH